MIWWEKTVEYMFVIKAVRMGRLRVAPLDGRHETWAADLLAATENGGWLLIEFKRSGGISAKEQGKWNGFLSVAENLHSAAEQCHFLVSGLEWSDCELDCKTYFLGKSVAGLPGLFTQGVSAADFLEYLDWLKYKKNGIVEWGGSAAEAFSLVAAVDQDGKLVGWLTVDEFEQGPGLQLQLQISQENEVNPSW